LPFGCRLIHELGYRPQKDYDGTFFLEQAELNGDFVQNGGFPQIGSFSEKFWMK